MATLRIWDIHPTWLCDKHLLAEHHELHGIWSILTTDRVGGYRNHPETRRWVGKLPALHKRHELEVREMARRGFNHKSPLDLTGIEGAAVQDVMLQPLMEQVAILVEKECECEAWQIYGDVAIGGKIRLDKLMMDLTCVTPSKFRMQFINSDIDAIFSSIDDNEAII